MLSGSGRLRRLFHPTGNLTGGKMSYMEDEEEENHFVPEPAEVLACLTSEAVALIEEGESAETVIYYALETAYRYGSTAAEKFPAGNN